MKAKTFKIVAFSCAAVLLAVVMALSIAISIPMLRNLLDKFVVGYKEGEGTDAARASGAALSEQIQGEGSVLVKNDKPTETATAPLLPMSIADAPKVNVFGWDSTDWVVGGSGSGQVKMNDTVKFLDALTLAGIEYNTEITNMYENFRSRREYSENGGGINGGARDGGSLMSLNNEFSRLYEPSISNLVTNNKGYTQTMLDNAKTYSDTAIVVIGRVSGESNDSPRVQYKQTVSGGAIVTDQNRTYLEISTEEEELLTYVGENYSNVVVLINSTNVMELGFMETIPGLDACLVVATTGSHGTRAIPRLLYKDLTAEGFTPITPSGKLADTYAYDLSTSSTYVDMGTAHNGVRFYSNSKSNMYPMTVRHTNTRPGTSEAYGGVAYQDYREGIYVGYKWYETADEMGFWTSGYAKSHWTKPDGTPINGYNDVVQYPFGYGLSYTSFSWEVTHLSHVPDRTLSASAIRNESITVGVEVTNTGSVAGQDVVELYYSAPYTTDGIEKSSLNLLAFGKTTQVLQPGESQHVKLEFKISDMASYDTGNISGIVPNGGYVMEQGDYVLSLRTDAHTPVSADKLIPSNDVKTAEFKFHVGSDTRVLPEAENRFTGPDTTDGVAIDGNSDGSANITYLSRSNIEGTFPIEVGKDREMTQAIIDRNLYTNAMANAWDETHDDGMEYTFGDKTFSGIVYEEQTITDEEGNEEKRFAINELGKKLGLDYGAPEWEDLLNRISKSEMESITLHGYTKTRAIPSIGKPETLDLDGPNQIGSYNDKISSKATGFSSIVLAQSWNLELAYSMGLAFGNECNALGVQGWYGPGLNVHRSPFGGRNYEYYSEDAYMSGMMCAKVVQATKNKGVFSYLKHLCLYEGESNRDGMYTWLTEQSLREVYAKPFELAVKVGGSNAMMTSYGRIGAVWTGGSEALLTELVRGEWGFKGAFLTDYADNHSFMNGNQMIRAGGDIWMDGYQDNGSYASSISNSNAFNASLRRATKNIVYMWLNSLATNAEYNEKIASGEINDSISIPVSPVLNFRWYIPVIVIADIALTAGAAVLIFLGIKKKDKLAPAGADNTEPVAEPVPEEDSKAEPVTQQAAPESAAEEVKEPVANPEAEATETPAPKKSKAKKTPPSEE